MKCQLNRIVQQVVKVGSVIFVYALTTVSVQAGPNSIIDCPLRDATYTIDLPLMEILLKPEALDVVSRNMPGVMDKMSPQFANKDAPSISAILSLKSIAAMSSIPNQVLENMDGELRALKINDADRLARCARYDNVAPNLNLSKDRPNILVFKKINGFDHGPSVSAATDAVRSIGEEMGWNVVVTDKGGAFNAELLANFDAVVWNNTSGDVLTLSQRKAFKDYIEEGGGYMGIHGAGGDFIYLWDWYADTLLGARFIGHPGNPQFQAADIHVEKNFSRIGSSLLPGWNMTGEWYSFRDSPRKSGATIVATLDETTYQPQGYGGENLRMGSDHPIVWQRCIGKGRSFYTAIGHRPDAYDTKENLSLLRDALTWVAGKGDSYCEKGKQVRR